MGLLDDAIREHLELKRRRGADPGEIAHEERAVLDAGAGAGSEEVTEALHAPQEPGPDEELAPVAQETVEIDMQAVLGGQEAPVAAGERPQAEDALEWEMSPGDGGEIPQNIPGQERMAFEGDGD
jgi:hypothetical protein